MTAVKPETVTVVTPTDEDLVWARGLLENSSHPAQVVLGWLKNDTKLAAKGMPPKGLELRRALALLDALDEIDRRHVIEAVTS